MFERFTDRARRSVVLAQEEARGLRHSYIGTEHLLLGMLSDPGSVGAQAARRVGVTLASAREDVIEIVGRGKHEPAAGHIPFTPRAKRCLELALREALQLGHDYIGTEHVLLGILREGKGVAAQVLLRHGDLAGYRTAVTSLLPAPVRGGRPVRWGLRTGTRRTGRVILGPRESAGELDATPAADASLAEAARLAAGSPVGSHHLLLAALADADSAAARALSGLGVDLEAARDALRIADVTGTTDETPEEAGRRQMQVTVTADRVTVDARDPAIVALGRAAAEAAGCEDGIIRGDADGVSLGAVWQALHDSLEDLRRRAVPAGDPPAAAE